MTDLTYLKHVLTLLKEQGVVHIKMPGLEITLGSPSSKDVVQAQAPASDPLIDALKKQEESLPPDLRADDLMSADKVLNWSSPDGQESLPLTEDTPL